VLFNARASSQETNFGLEFERKKNTTRAMRNSALTIK